MKAYVLAAGYGTRMYPLTRDVPKGLLEVGGEPVLSHLMRKLWPLDGLTDVVVVTNDRFYDDFRSWAAGQETWARFTVLRDGTRSNEQRLGALGDLRLGLDRVPLDDDHALVLASDQLFEADLAEVYEAFLARRRTTMLARRVEHPEGRRSPYNEIVLGADGRILHMREKPPDPHTDLAAMALYFMPAEDLALLDEYLEVGEHDAPGHFLAWLVRRVPCFAVSLRGSWYDMGDLEGFEEAKRRWGDG